MRKESSAKSKSRKESEGDDEDEDDDESYNSEDGNIKKSKDVRGYE